MERNGCGICGLCGMWEALVVWESYGCMGKLWLRIWLGVKTHTCRADSGGFVGKGLLYGAALERKPIHVERKVEDLLENC